MSKLKTRAQGLTMAETEEKKQSDLFLRLPPELGTLLDEIKVVRAKNLEPLTNTSIVIDAVKEYHRNRVTK